MKAHDKIKEVEELENICRHHRREGRRIVFTNGCFDLLHLGHVRYLEAARALGDALIVALNTDRSVERIKGPLRPITRQEERCEVVAALCCVDYVTLFDTPDPLPLIELFQPDVLVKGADWPLGKIVGAGFVEGNGGKVVRIPLTPGTSTTMIIDRIVKRFGTGKEPG